MAQEHEHPESIGANQRTLLPADSETVRMRFDACMCRAIDMKVRVVCVTLLSLFLASCRINPESKIIGCISINTETSIWETNEFVINSSSPSNQTSVSCKHPPASRCTFTVNDDHLIDVIDKARKDGKAVDVTVKEYLIYLPWTSKSDGVFAMEVDVTNRDCHI